MLNIAEVKHNQNHLLIQNMNWDGTQNISSSQDKTLEMKDMIFQARKQTIPPLMLQLISQIMHHGQVENIQPLSQEIIMQANGLVSLELLDQVNISLLLLLMMDQNSGSMINQKLIIGVVTEEEDENQQFNYKPDGTQLRLNTLRMVEVLIWLFGIRDQTLMIKKQFVQMKFTIPMNKLLPQQIQCMLLNPTQEVPLLVLLLHLSSYLHEEV